MSQPQDFLRSEAFERARLGAAERLVSARCAAGHWVGRLSSSALATATALAALRLVDARAHAAAIRAGAAWLRATQLADGSWGDTVASPGNLSTTLLAWAALGAVAADDPAAAPADDRAAGRRAEAWIGARAGGLTPERLAAALAAIYGRDRTFSVPILTHLALCGRLGDPRASATWRHVPQLPFELAALPRAWFRAVDLQVVSYALPALIAIGQLRHARLPAGPPLGLLRDAARGRTLTTLAAIQPSGGGFLEATPLTSFVTMSLAGMGLAAHPVARQGAAFLRSAQRPDGAWPIDTNLATWATTQSIAALAAGGRLAAHLAPADRETLCRWLLDQQWLTVHPSTGAAPGGWAWTDLPGGVPDADDTSGAVTALGLLAAAGGGPPPAVAAAAAAGLRWLADLANRDGGMPTFCRGWGRLPFDTSCPDITAHFLRAAGTWGPHEPRIGRALAAARAYLARTRQLDGSWLPLWFGSQQHPTQDNPAYGTARVVLATGDPRGALWLADLIESAGAAGAARGVPPTIEETALVVEALAAVALDTPDSALAHRAGAAVATGARWLVEHTAGGTHFPAAPIGLYFAKLWYDEELYPLAFTVGALERAARVRERSRG